MTLNRSRSSRTTAIDSASSALVTGQGVRDAVGQELAVGQPGRRVVEGPALGDIDEPGVVERDRGELGEAGQGVDVPRGPSADRCARTRDRARRPTRPPEVSGTPTTDPNMPVGSAGRAAVPRVVVVDRERRAGRDDRAAEALVDGDAVPEIAVEQAGAVAHDERSSPVGLAQVDVPVRRPEQGGRPSHDGLQQAGPGRGGRAARARSRRARAGRDRRGRRRRGRGPSRLDQVQRAVGDRDEFVLRRGRRPGSRRRRR